MFWGSLLGSRARPRYGAGFARFTVSLFGPICVAIGSTATPSPPNPTVTCDAVFGRSWTEAGTDPAYPSSGEAALARESSAG
eukprot:2738614-Pyramimonas_sp.AAC.1